MGYVADTFVAGEQPTTAKWNELWSNDASMHDGSGIAAGSILPNHLLAAASSNNNWTWDTWSPTITGFSVNPTGTTRYLKVGKVVFFNAELIGGTSNATTFTITAPVAANATASNFQGGAQWSTQDNGTTLNAPGRWFIDPSTPTIINFGRQLNSDAWTASGTKGTRTTGFYEAA